MRKKKPPEGGFFLLNLSDDSIESLWVVVSEVSEDLAVDLDTLLLYCSHKLGVGETLCVESGVDLYDPEVSAVTLLVAAVCKSVCAGVRDRFVCCALVGRSAESIAFDLLEDIPPRLKRVYSFFYSCHGIGY